MEGAREMVFFLSATTHNVLRISVGRGGNGRTEGEEAATQFCVGLSRVGAIWSLSNQLEQAGDR